MTTRDPSARELALSLPSRINARVVAQKAKPKQGSMCVMELACLLVFRTYTLYALTASASVVIELYRTRYSDGNLSILA